MGRGEEVRAPCKRSGVVHKGRGRIDNDSSPTIGESKEMENRVAGFQADQHQWESGAAGVLMVLMNRIDAAIFDHPLTVFYDTYKSVQL